MRQRIPVLLEEYRAIARERNLAEPNSECKAGWCLQCQCPEKLINDLFGDVEYIIQPQIPPIAGSILPCISRRRVMTFDLTEMFALAKNHGKTKDCRLYRREPVFARLFSVQEQGTNHFAKTVSGAIVKTSTIGKNDVLVKQRLGLAPGVAEAVVELSTFQARYGAVPGDEFAPYGDLLGIAAVELSTSFINDLSQEDIPLFVKHNREVFAVLAGDVVTSSGSILRRELIAREFVMTIQERSIIDELNYQEMKP